MKKNTLSVRIKSKYRDNRAFKLISWAVCLLLLAAIAGISAVGIKYVVIESRANAAQPLERDNCYYYNTLSWRDQQLYDAIVTAAGTAQERTEVLPYNFEMDTFETVVNYVMADNPDLFYVKYSELVLNHGRHKTYVGMTYCAKGDELDSLRSEYDSALDEGVQAVRDAKDDFAKELAVHDWIIDRCEYAVGETDNLYNTAYGALVRNTAYCDGYAYAVKAILDRTGVSSAIVYGSVNDAEHVWNLVRVDGRYYHTDAMWDDADLSYGENLRFHGYFNLDDNAILLDHSYYYDDILPEADSTKDYYTALGLRAETVQDCEEVMYRALLTANASKGGFIELYCTETKDNEQLAIYYKNAVARANTELGAEVFLTAFRVFDASNTSNAMTIQIFYN